MYKVVIIDDEPWTRDVIKSLGEWNKLDLEVAGEASDGETGWLLIKKLLPDIVITDVRMPGINGLELIGMMRGEKIESPAIIISGYDDYEYVHKALKLGVMDYLLKPIKPLDLNTQLQNCVSEIKKDALLPQNVVRAEFIPDELEKECQKILSEIMVLLQLRKKGNLEESLDELEKIIVSSTGGNPAQSIQIGIYYEVLSVLQKYVDQIGIAREEVLGNLNDGFVFGRENTIHEMIEHFKGLFFKAVDYVENNNRKKSRLDTDAILRYLGEHFKDGVTLEETADYFHISKEYLSKVFKSDQNIGFSDYVLKLRMEKATELIKVYNAPLKEVGFLVGYTDVAHFYKTFKKYYGITPGELRASLKNDNDL